MMQDLFGSIDFNYLWGQVLRLISDPYSNITAALLLLAAVVLVVLIIASIVIAVVTGWTSRPRGQQEIEELQYLISVLDAEQTGEAPPERPSATPPERWARLRAFPWLAFIGISFVATLVMGLSLGATTGSSEVCGTCHTGTSHSKAVRAGIADAHRKVDCIACHESSGWLGSLSIEVPGRFAHFANALKKDPPPTGYGSVVSAPCYSCHRSVARETTTDKKRGVKMAHKQPLEAGAECRDCHTSPKGVVSSLTVGMTPCLRCHDGKKQSSECTLCHTKDVGVATRAHIDPVDLKGRDLIETPDCGSCHDVATKCDPCHGGVRMPHTQLFKAYAHAREGTKDLWFNSGKACRTCHTAARRPCTKCHVMLPGHPVREWPALHGVGDNAAACATCHDEKANVPGRDFCKLCHTKPYVTQ